jgi:membrane associated rhomboid family serine protease
MESNKGCYHSLTGSIMPVSRMTTESISGKTILLIFVLCAAADFLWGYFNGHTLGAAVIAAILGLFGTAFYVFWLSRQP